MASIISNKAQVFEQIQLAMARIEEAPIAAFRKVVLQIFIRILEQTPQFSGRAVANWNIGINAPDLSVDQNMGDDLELSKGGHVKDSRRHKGDRKWLVESLERAKYVIRKIKRGDIVYITNSVRGDSFNRKGGGSEAYLKELQDPATWASRLRAVNKPYETAIESAIFVAEGLLASGNVPFSGLESN